MDDKILGEYTTKDYIESMSAPDTDQMFTLAYQWQDKPHRHVYDLCKHIDKLNSRISILDKALEKIDRHLHNEAFDEEVEILKAIARSARKGKESHGKDSMPKMS